MEEVQLEKNIMFDIFCPIKNEYYLIKMSKDDFNKNKSRAGCYSAAIYITFQCDCGKEHMMRLY